MDLRDLLSEVSSSDPWILPITTIFLSLRHTKMRGITAQTKGSFKPDTPIMRNVFEGSHLPEV